MPLLALLSGLGGHDFVPDGLRTRAETVVTALRSVQDSRGTSGPAATVHNAVLYVQGNLRRRFMPSPVRTYLVAAFGHHGIAGAPPSKPTMRLRLVLLFNAMSAVAHAFVSTTWDPIDNPPGTFWDKSWALTGPRAFLAQAEEFFSYDDVVAVWRDHADRLRDDDS